MIKTNIDKLQEAAEKQVEHAKLLDEAYKKCFESALSTQNGKCAFQLLHKLSLWEEMSDNDTSESLIYKRGRRDMWNMIRQYIPKQILAEIEIYKEHEITIK